MNHYVFYISLLNGATPYLLLQSLKEKMNMHAKRKSITNVCKIFFKSNESSCIKSTLKSSTAKTFVTEITYLWDSMLHSAKASLKQPELLKLNSSAKKDL